MTEDSSLKIKEAIYEDASLLASIIRESFVDVARKFQLSMSNAPTHPSNCKSDWITSALEKGIRYFIIYKNNNALGCVALEKANELACYMERLGVIPQFRRQGHGSRLVNIALQEAKKLRVERVEIGIIAEDDRLKTWYEKRGFILKEVKKFDHLPFKVAFMYVNID
ncbi:MAG: GNAT family N-acetyltransferase [Promethearchaeota archaeon]